MQNPAEENIVKLSDFQKFVRQMPPTYDPKDITQRSRILEQMGLDADNIYQELEMSNPFVDTHMDVSFSGTPVNLHSHDFYELLYCTNTCGVEYLVGAERYRLQKGDVIIVPPGISHRPLLPAVMEEPYRRIVLWINRNFMERMLMNFPEARDARQGQVVMLRTGGTRWENIGGLFENGLQESQSSTPESLLLLVGNTLTLLGQIHRAVMDRSTDIMAAEKPQLLEQVLSYIEKNLSEKIALADVAHQFFVSESTVSQLFRKKMGVSFYRCVTQRRLIAAKALITEGNPLEQVAEKTGFGDYSAFYRAFKQEYGISPRQYRNLQGK
jgi:AraC-like DNA-binding protein